MTTLADFTLPLLDGTSQSLAVYAGKVVLVVNTASQCGLTPQYTGLEALWQQYRDEGLVVLGFPCNQFGGQEPGTANEIAQFCETNFGVSFPLFAKLDVNGPREHPLYTWLKAGHPGDIEWNFAKFLIGRDGHVVARFAPAIAPADLAGAIAQQLKPAFLRRRNEAPDRPLRAHGAVHPKRRKSKMKKILMASVAALALTAALPAFAQDKVVAVQPGAEADANAGAVVGASGGGATGAVIGGLLGGPIGAIIGGFAGATIGAEAGVAATSVEYVAANPVEPIYIDAQTDIGFVVPADVTIYPIQGDDAYGYIYANDRVWIVDLETRALVQSPGYLVPQTAADYALANPTTSIEAQGDVVVGYVLPDGTQVSTIPDSRYGYVYLNDRPALVDSTNRTVIWIN